MDLILLGSGNAATQLGNSLQKAGYRFVQLFSRREENAHTLSRMLGDCPYTTDLSQIDPSIADAVISALKDSADEEVWQQINFGNTPAFHTAGTMPMDALAPHAKHRGVLYPLQTLTKARLLDFRTVPLFIEAESPETMTLLQDMANAISDNVREVNSEQRRSIHLAAVFLCRSARPSVTPEEERLHRSMQFVKFLLRCLILHKIRNQLRTLALIYKCQHSICICNRSLPDYDHISHLDCFRRLDVCSIKTHLSAITCSRSLTSGLICTD